MSLEQRALEELQKRISDQDKKIIELSSDVLNLKERVDANTKIIETYADFVNGLKFGLKLLRHMQLAAIWIASMAGAAGVIFVLWKYAITQTLSVK